MFFGNDMGKQNSKTDREELKVDGGYYTGHQVLNNF